MKALTVKLLCLLILAPVASLWASYQEIRILKTGEVLTEEQLHLAKQIGLHHPEKIRLLREDKLAFPCPQWAEKLLNKMGFQVIDAAGMSLRYGIFISNKIQLHPRLLSHELAHTLQYERLGSVYSFMYHYLFQCIYLGYQNAPMEKEADELAEQVLNTHQPSSFKH